MHSRLLAALGLLACLHYAPLARAAEKEPFKITAVSIEGGLEEASVRSALTEQVAQLVGCTAPGDAPTISNPIAVKVQVVKGKVARFATEDDRGADPKRMRCVERELRKFRFPRADAAAVVHVTLAPVAAGAPNAGASPAAAPSKPGAAAQPAVAAKAASPAPGPAPAAKTTAPTPARSASAANAQFEVTSTVGPITAPAAQTALQGKAEQVLACAQKQPGGVSGELGIKLQVNTAGRIDRHALKSNGTNQRKLGECVMKAVQGTTFGATQGSTILEVKLTLHSPAQAEEPVADVSGLPEAPERSTMLDQILMIRPEVEACTRGVSGRVAIKTVFHGPSGEPRGVRMKTRFPSTVQKCMQTATMKMRTPPFKKRNFEVLFTYDL